MIDTNGLLKVKRGRPKKTPEDSIRKVIVVPYGSDLAMSKYYSDLQIIYKSKTYTQKLRNMILKVPSIIKLPNHIRKLQIRNFLEDCAKEFIISELELVGFTIVLDKLIINNLSIHIEELFKLCFFISKNVCKFIYV